MSEQEGFHVAGSGLIGIKRRIKSVTNTKKITKAMGLVATSKLRKVREVLNVNSVYNDSLNKIIDEITASDETENIYKDGNGSRKKLYIVFTSDSGLCGAFNLNVLNRSLQEFAGIKEEVEIMVIGEKGTSFFNRTNYEVKYKFINIPDVPTLGDANDYAMVALKLYKSGEVGEINVIFTQSESQTKHEVVIEKMLPLGESRDKKPNSAMNFEPEVSTLLDSIIPLYARQKILNYLIQSKTSEQSIRMSAMDGATKNANELLDKLKLQYNRMRQGAITQEISEIVGGAEAQR